MVGSYLSAVLLTNRGLIVRWVHGFAVLVGDNVTGSVEVGIAGIRGRLFCAACCFLEFRQVVFKVANRSRTSVALRGAESNPSEKYKA